MTFTFRKAVREKTPLLIGLVGPSGSGKTYSALRLATGIQQATGGKIVGIDTEARRMLHYADKFNFEYLEFCAPFGSDRYCEALKAAAEESKGGVVIVDSMSHEHEGQGGYLEFHEAELDRIAGDDWKKRERSTFTAWIKPAAARRRLINTILQLHCGGFIFCFRAKEKLKIVKGQEPITLGWQAIAGEEFAFEMGIRCLLQPGARGVPDWSQGAMNLGVPKISEGMERFFTDGQPLDEALGQRLAHWAAGTSAAQVDTPTHVDKATGEITPTDDWVEPYLDRIANATGTDSLKTEYEAAKKKAEELNDKPAYTRIVKATNAKKALLATPAKPAPYADAVQGIADMANDLPFQAAK